MMRASNSASYDTDAKTFKINGDLVVQASYGEIKLADLLKHIGTLEDRIKQLETAYMEEKLLGNKD